MAQRVPLPDEGQAEEMRTWVNKRCCAIWRDYCRHGAKRRVLNCRQPRRIPELPYLLEQSRQIAAAYAGKS